MLKLYPYYGLIRDQPRGTRTDYSSANSKPLKAAISIATHCNALENILPQCLPKLPSTVLNCNGQPGCFPSQVDKANENSLPPIGQNLSSIDTVFFQKARNFLTFSLKKTQLVTLKNRIVYKKGVEWNITF